MPLPAFCQRPGHSFDLFAGDGTGTQQGDLPVQHRDDRAFHPHGAGAAIDSRAHGMARLFHGVVEGRRTGPSRTIGRGRDDRPAEGADYRPRARMARHAHGHAVQPRPRQITHPLAIAHRGHNGQRPRPEGLGQRARLGVEHGDRLGVHGVGDMSDQGIEARPTLGLEDSRHRLRIGGVGCQTIDRLGRQDDQAPRFQRLGGDFGAVASGGSVGGHSRPFLTRRQPFKQGATVRGISTKVQAGLRPATRRPTEAQRLSEDNR